VFTKLELYGMLKPIHREGVPTMEIQEIYAIENELEQINEIYEYFNEDTRLNHSKAARVEFLTNVRYIEKYLEPGDKILDIGAGAGEYSLYFSRKGFDVCSLELSDKNVKAFREKLTPEDRVELTQGNAVDLSLYEDNFFDIVLLFGPLYHLHSERDRQKCISEAKRVCKKDGHIFFAFISNDMVLMTELSYRQDYFLNGDYDKETFKLNDFPFVFFTVDGCRRMLEDAGIEIMHEVASDGFSELMAERINAMDDESFKQYLRYHYYICEKPELLGASNHLLFVGR
jgi:ubiquinone/menaquinone biosynthesis C-methylase UbiE